MKIALIAPSPVPFVVGGAEKLWWGLLHQINQHSDHQLELLKLPSPERNFGELMASYQRFAELDVSHFDRVITTKYPAWMVEHPEHYVYLQHTLRGLYDAYSWPERAGADPFEAAAWPNEKGRQGIRLLRHHPRVKGLRRLLQASPERAQLPALFAQVRELIDDRTLPPFAREGLLHFPGPVTRAIIHRLDAIALAPKAIRRYAAISRNVTRRAHYFPKGVPIQVIHHPSDLPVFEGRKHDYLFTVSRLDSPKRLDLLIRAFRQTQVNCELRIAGTGPAEAELRTLAAGDERIRFLGFVRDSEIVEQYRDALAVPFLPADEDYGLITVEAMGAAKAVITCTDSGGTNEFVEHGVTGWSVAPQVDALAAAITQAVEEPERTQQMGQAAKARVAHVNWPDTVRYLLADNLLAEHSLVGDLPNPTQADAPASKEFPVVIGIGGGAELETSSPETNSREANGRDKSEYGANQFPAKAEGFDGPHWLVLNTYPVYPPMGGGQSRMFHLYRHIARELNVRVTLLVLAPADGEEACHEIAPGLFEHRVPLSAAQQRHLRKLTQELQASVEDIAAIHGWEHNPAFISVLRKYATTATLGVCAHPYLVHALTAHYSGPWLYEAHNVETDLKRSILAQAQDANPSVVEQAAVEQALKDVEVAESLACRQSTEILACAEGDLALFRQRYGLSAGKGLVIPNCADLSALPMVDMPTRRRWQSRLFQRRPVALFLGSLHGPNLEAADFIRERLAPKHPQVIFYLAGSLSQHSNFHELPDNVRALGRVSDAELRVLLASVDVALNPMFSGSGSNLKMLDYTASGVPVLSTPFGNRGLDFTEEAIWLANKEQFVEALGTLLAEPDQALQARVENARQRTERHFSWPQAVKALVPVLG